MVSSPRKFIKGMFTPPPEQSLIRGKGTETSTLVLGRGFHQKGHEKSCVMTTDATGLRERQGGCTGNVTATRCLNKKEQNSFFMSPRSGEGCTDDVIHRNPERGEKKRPPVTLMLRRGSIKL